MKKIVFLMAVLFGISSIALGQDHPVSTVPVSFKYDSTATFKKARPTIFKRVLIFFSKPADPDASQRTMEFMQEVPLPLLSSRDRFLYNFQQEIKSEIMANRMNYGYAYSVNISPYIAVCFPVYH